MSIDPLAQQIHKSPDIIGLFIVDLKPAGSDTLQSVLLRLVLGIQLQGQIEHLLALEALRIG
jgi:hypothetical protein